MPATGKKSLKGGSEEMKSLVRWIYSTVKPTQAPKLERRRSSPSKVCEALCEAIVHAEHLGDHDKVARLQGRLLAVKRGELGIG